MKQWEQMVKDLGLPNEEQFIKLLKRTPADPLFYLLKVQNSVGVDAKDYYKILMKKYEEEKNSKFFKIAQKCENLLL